MDLVTSCLDEGFAPLGNKMKMWAVPVCHGTRQSLSMYLASFQCSAPVDSSFKPCKLYSKIRPHPAILGVQRPRCQVFGFLFFSPPLHIRAAGDLCRPDFDVGLEDSIFPLPGPLTVLSDIQLVLVAL